MKRFMVAVFIALILPTVAFAHRKHWTRVQELLVVAKRQVGVPYRWGGTSPRTGFDCSGLVGYVFRKVGVLLPRTTQAMLLRGRRIARKNLRPGDVVFFWDGDHVAIYRGGGKIEDAAHTGTRVGIRLLASYSGYYTARRYLLGR